MGVIISNPSLKIKSNWRKSALTEVKTFDVQNRQTFIVEVQNHNLQLKWRHISHDVFKTESPDGPDFTWNSFTSPQWVRTISAPAQTGMWRRWGLAMGGRCLCKPGLRSLRRNLFYIKTTGDGIFFILLHILGYHEQNTPPKNKPWLILQSNYIRCQWKEKERTQQFL